MSERRRGPGPGIRPRGTPGGERRGEPGRGFVRREDQQPTEDVSTDNGDGQPEADGRLAEPGTAPA